MYQVSEKELALSQSLFGPTENISDESVRAIFGPDSSGGLANQLALKHPEVYRRVREQRAVPMGLLWGVSAPTPQELAPPPTPPKGTVTEKDLRESVERTMRRYLSEEKRGV